MNWTVFILQNLVLCLLFGALIIGLLQKDPLSFVSDYPPEIQEAYYTSQNLPRPRGSYTGKEIFRKSISLVIALFPLAWMAHVAGAQGFWSAAFTVFAYLMIVAAFDTFILDWILVPRVRRWRLPGTEHMDQAYAQKWFHVKVVLPMLPLFFLYSMACAGILCLLY